MTTVFEPTSSKLMFVGREDERNKFSQMMAGECSEWIILIPGSGGIGKTRLLETLRNDARDKEKILFTRELVDFYNPGYQTPLGLLKEIAHQLDLARFGRFLKECEFFEKLLFTTPEPGQRQEAFNRVVKVFLDEYECLLRMDYRLIMLFDTCEEMHGVEDFLLHILLPGICQLEQHLFDEAAEETRGELRRKSLVVIAGRKQLDFPAELDKFVYVWGLQPLRLDEMRQFFAQDAKLDAEQVQKLYVRTAGHPLFVALSYDWLVNGVGSWDELLTLDIPFGAKLVEWVRRLDSMDKKAILFTALAWRRMEPSMLAILLDISPDDADVLIRRLSRFSFVKYRPPDEGFLGTFQLHDEMRSLILTYVWTQEGEGIQKQVYQRVLEWYEKRIGDPGLLDGSKLPWQSSMPPDEARALLAEYIYYTCQLDVERAFILYEKLFRFAVYNLDLELCDLLNQEIERFVMRLNRVQQDDLGFRQALVAFRREDFAFASNIWHSLLRREELSPYYRATVAMLLVELDCYTGSPDEALEHAQDSEKYYQELIQTEKDPGKLSILKNELGQLYNNWGYTYRVKGQFDKALESYQKVLELRGKEKNFARTLNNMGYLFFLKGDIISARTYVGRALQIRHQLNIPYESGLGYNTMGIIMEQSGRVDNAADSYHKALLEFEAARSDRGKAMVLLNQGRIDRKTNRYLGALENLEKARSVFAQKGDIDNLVTTLNELGCVYRGRSNPGDFQKAEEWYKESLRLAEKLGAKFNQIDNWADLSILYTRMAIESRKCATMTEVDEFTLLARQSANKVEDFCKDNKFIYLRAKKERTLGDLEYDAGNYDQSFEHYFQACNLMTRVQGEGRTTPVLSQRRFEENVDRLQEQLQALVDPEKTRYYAEKLLIIYNGLSDEDKELLLSVKQFLKASLDMVDTIERHSV